MEERGALLSTFLFSLILNLLSLRLWEILRSASVKITIPGLENNSDGFFFLLLCGLGRTPDIFVKCKGAAFLHPVLVIDAQALVKFHDFSLELIPFPVCHWSSL